MVFPEITKAESPQRKMSNAEPDRPLLGPKIIINRQFFYMFL